MDRYNAIGLDQYLPPKPTIADDNPTKSAKIGSYTDRPTKGKQARGNAGETTNGNPVSPYEGMTVD